MLNLDQQLDEALARIKALEADAQARENLLSEAAAKGELLSDQLAEANANHERLEADFKASQEKLEALGAERNELEEKLNVLAARNSDIEAREQNLELRASKMAAEIVASTGTAAPLPVTPKADNITEDLVARFRAISNPSEQTTFWRSLSAREQALILSTTH